MEDTMITEEAGNTISPTTQQTPQRGLAVYTGIVALLGSIVGAGGGTEIHDAIVSDTSRARTSLRRILRDPKETDALIQKLIQDKGLVAELENDPEMVQNLDKLAKAVGDRIETGLADKLTELQNTKDLLEAARPKKEWAKTVADALSTRWDGPKY
jgi:hypothetical protein